MTKDVYKQAWLAAEFSMWLKKHGLGRIPMDIWRPLKSSFLRGDLIISRDLEDGPVLDVFQAMEGELP